jgi:hypothetical protein
MFKPSQFAKPPDTTVYSTPGIARAASSLPISGQTSRVHFSFLNPSENTHISFGGAAGSGQPPDSHSHQPVESHLGQSGNDPPSGGSSNKSSHQGHPRGGPSGPPGPPGNGPPHGPPGGGPPQGPPGGRPPHGAPGGRPSDRRQPAGPPGPPGGEPPDPSSGGATIPSGRNPSHNSAILTGQNKWINTRETHFDTKLKPDIIPVWNGDETALGRWISQVNELALRSSSVFKGLGDIVPTRFRDKAQSWWYSLEDAHRLLVSQDWDTLKEEIRTYWMNQAWIERTQRKALRARYREPGFAQESPTDYYIRKVELLSLVYNFTPSQVMSEVLQ